MNIYNTVLLDGEGIIQQVRTLRAPLQKRVQRHITFYTFSMEMEQDFTKSFLPFHFIVDEGEAMQEVILSGLTFINQSSIFPDSYAELVIALGGTDDYDVSDIVQPLFFNNWKAFSWRTIRIPGYSGFSISLQGTVRIPAFV